MLVAVYGTLRNGDYNHNFYMRDSTYKGVERVPGFQMYDLGSYPYIIHDKFAHENASILVELYDVPQDNYEKIKAMEEGAGYITEEVGTLCGTAKLFVMSERVHKMYMESKLVSKIISGDWFNRSERVVI